MRVPGRCCDCGPRATTVEKMPLLRDGNSSLKRAGVVGAWGQRSTAIDSLGLWPLVSIWWERRIIAAAILEGMAASLKRNVYAHIKIYILKSRRISAIPRIQRWRRGFSHGPLRIPDRFFLGSEIADADKTLRILYTPPTHPHTPPTRRWYSKCSRFPVSWASSSSSWSWMVGTVKAGWAGRWNVIWLNLDLIGSSLIRIGQLTEKIETVNPSWGLWLISIDFMERLDWLKRKVASINGQFRECFHSETEMTTYEVLTATPL